MGSKDGQTDYNHEGKSSWMQRLHPSSNAQNKLVQSYHDWAAHMSLSIMVADVNYNIVYMNASSNKLLKTLEHLLPIKVESMIGSSIDVFHKNPKMQRDMLSDRKNLPHQAQIKLGSEFLDLNISAIIDAKDELQGFVLVWSVVSDEFKKNVEALLVSVQNASQGDLTTKITVKGESSLGKIGNELELFLGSMCQSISSIDQNSQALAAAAEELTAVGTQMHENADTTSSQANVVSAAAEEVSKSLQMVASSSEQLNTSIKQIAKNTTEATKIATQAVKVTETTNITITKLGDSSAEIGNVVKVITSIAQQTNLLALNATIEAARAGEAGKGFAVVANEVKELAKATAKATEDISRKIETIQNDTKSAVSAISEISSIIKQINDIQVVISAAIEEQSITTNEIGRNVSEAAKGGAEIAENITGVAMAAQSTAAGASDSKKAAAELARMATELERLLSKFKY
jgi:methyl-accepting chemotaxis protein